jgi:hypothetical protein
MHLNNSGIGTEIVRFSSILITDVIDIASVNEPRWIIVKKGLGFYGNGTLDPWGDIPCGCVTEDIIIRPGEDYTKCGPCPDDLGEL